MRPGALLPVTILTEVLGSGKSAPRMPAAEPPGRENTDDQEADGEMIGDGM